MFGITLIALNLLAGVAALPSPQDTYAVVKIPGLQVNSDSLVAIKTLSSFREH